MMQNNLELDTAQQRKGRIIFLMMAIFFIIPILVVVLMFKFDWKPSGQSKGELINPPRQIDATLVLNDHKGNPSQKFWNEKWNMVFVAEKCEAICMAKLHDMRQIHVSTYKDMLRVQRVLITKQANVEHVLARYPDILVINQPEKNIDDLARYFDIGSEYALVSNRTYLVDPLGHVMMSYHQGMLAADIRKDLTRLLKFSWAG
jgi:cytochrome oxidase Cu insertion factor (SCO1/SenC/PrrC family)